MPRKLSYEEVKIYVESQGYKLLSDVYKNARTKIEMKCPQEHFVYMTFDSFKAGHRCSKCTGNKKLTIEEVKDFIEKEGYKLLSREYLNNHTKLEIKCPYNHIFFMGFKNFKKGHRCPECSGNKKISFKEVREFISEQGYSLLSEEYLNSREKLKICCPKNHIFKMNFYDFKSGHRCPQCLADKRKLDYKEVKEFITKQGYKLLSNEYKRCEEKLKMCCPKGHIFEMSFSHFKNRGQRCPQCHFEKLQAYTDFGHKFEHICKEVFDLIRSHWEYQYTGINGIRPDFYEKETNTIIDAKLTSYAGFYKNKDGESTKEKYLPYCDKLIFVYLVGHEINDPDVEVININSFYDELRSVHRDDLIQKTEELKNKFYKFEKESNLKREAV